MSQWSSAKAKRVLAALLRIGWNIKRESSSHKILSCPGWPDVVFAFHDKDEIGPKMLARMAKHTGLEPKDLYLNGCFRGRPNKALQLTAP
jgi:predicted RNA binding protein YcfA (HicA-like mRNA interferase family)